MYLPRAVPLALESCNLDAGTAVDFEDSEEEGDAPSGFGGVSSDEDSHDNRRVRNFSVRRGVLDEKAAATQALGAFAVHTKAGFSLYLSQCLDVLKRHAGYFHEDVRLQAMIALEHVFTATRAAFPVPDKRIMPLAVKELGSTEPTNKRNAAFCVGELCKNGGETSLKYYNSILIAMNPLFGDNESDDAVRDNAAGAIARMIMTQPQAIPLAQVLPVFVSALPLKEDLGESMAVYNCLCSLLVGQHTEIVPLIPQIVHIFAKVAASQRENIDVKSLIGRTAKQLCSYYGSQLQVVFDSLPADVGPALVSIISSS